MGDERTRLDLRIPRFRESILPAPAAIGLRKPPIRVWGVGGACLRSVAIGEQVGGERGAAAAGGQKEQQ